MEKLEAIKKFGLDPDTIGIRNRGWDVLDEENELGYPAGTLVVYSRDGAGNIPDDGCSMHPNYLGQCEDDCDQTYLYYYFAPMPK